MNVSIIVPYSNAEQTLARCVSSLQAQRYDSGSIEILLIENRSTDRTSEIAAGLRGVRRLREDHPSVYAARNRAARESSGEILFFTQADCVAEPDWVQQHINHLRRCSASVSVGRLAPVRSTRLLALFESYESVRDDWNFSSGYWKQYFGRPTNLAIRRDRFESDGPFEEVLRGADTLLVQKLAREHSCDEIAYCPAAVVKLPAIDGMGSCLKRRFRDSRIMRSLRSSHSAPIRWPDRVRLFRTTIREKKYGMVAAATLLALLSAGVVVWKAGQWSAALWPTAATEL